MSNSLIPTRLFVEASSESKRDFSSRPGLTSNHNAGAYQTLGLLGQSKGPARKHLPLNHETLLNFLLYLTASLTVPDRDYSSG